MIKIEVKDSAVLDALTRLLRAAEDPRPALRDIGELLVASTKQRFATSTGPGGEHWPANSYVTIQRMLAKKKGAYSKKTGKLAQSGAGAVTGKKPLIGESRRLSAEISYALVPGGVEIGSNMEYAAMQHFGGKKSAFPHLWGDIPSRPFLGVSDEDRSNILDIFNEYLAAQWK